MQSSGLRKKIVFAGVTNSGKSSLVNAIVGESIAITSNIEGTTTDSLSRAFELLGYGAVTICDTAGFADNSELGTKRQEASLQTLKTADLVILVVANNELNIEDNLVLKQIKNLNLPYIIAYNKSDIVNYDVGKLKVSAKTGEGIDGLIEEIIKRLKQSHHKKILEGLVNKGDSVLLVMPQDTSAPEGRLILPQVQVIRECIDRHAIATCIALEELAPALKKCKYDLVITDTQVIKQVLETVDSNQKVSTFSILFGKAKGDVDKFLKGLQAIDSLEDGDTVMITEACVHTTNHDDIGKVMLPKIIQAHTGKKINFEFVNGKKLVTDFKGARLILQCGGCMLTTQEMQARIDAANNAGIAITNYGLAITKCLAKDINRLTF